MEPEARHSPVRASTLAVYRPRREWFARDPSGIHGLAHETRVLIWTQTLAAMPAAGTPPLDAEALGWAAAIHDTQRHDDGGDPEHGERAAAWAERNLAAIAPAADLPAVAYLCRWHVPPDRVCPDVTATLAAFKDADALDRWRIGGPDPRYLRTPAARSLLEPSCLLYEHTSEIGYREVDGAFESIIDRAVSLGLLAGD